MPTASEWIGLATAVIGLVGTVIGVLIAIRSARKDEVPIPIPPDDADTKAILERTIWERRPPIRPLIYNSSKPPVVLISNMKGGVGKTTITANVGAHFSTRNTLNKVLLIDFDYQGSLSQAMLGQRGIADLTMSAHHLILGAKNPEDLIHYAPATQYRARDPGTIRLFSTFYPFSTIENEEMVNWVNSPGTEFRYKLLQYLASESFKSTYDICIIDCPPRITTATVNALCSGSHLLIPTQPDGLAIPAVSYFAKQLQRMHAESFPKLRLMGVVPSITLESTGLKQIEEERLAELARDLADTWPERDRSAGDIVLREAFVPRSQPIRDAAGRGVVYFRHTPSARIFARLGEEIARRL